MFGNPVASAGTEYTVGALYAEVSTNASKPLGGLGGPSPFCAPLQMYEATKKVSGDDLGPVSVSKDPPAWFKKRFGSHGIG